MKKSLCNDFPGRQYCRRMIVKVLLTNVMLLFCFFTCIAAGLSQNRVANLSLDNVALSTALKHLGKAGDCKFVFNYDDLSHYKVSASIQDKNVQECLDILLKDKPLKYEFHDEFIVISYREQAKAQPQVKDLTVVKGVVKDQNGELLPGVTVLVKGMSYGTATDVNGAFEMPLPLSGNSVTLVFSFIGMKTQEVKVENAKPLSITMEPEATMLNEVVATGYQTISRERSAGSAVILNTEKLDKIKAPNLTTKLEGMTPGLSTYGGEMKIRGTSSFAVSSSPLVVVDGQVVNQSLESLNPDDIESLTVLKDASATSLYGVRATNGVIVVTTKRAGADKVKFNISAGFYVNPLPDMGYLHYASTSDIIDFEQEYLLTDPVYMDDPLNYFALKNQLSTLKTYTRLERLYYEMAQGNMSQDQVDKEIAQMRKNDYRRAYQKALQQTSVTQDYNLSILKGGDRSNLFFSMRYENYGKYDKNASADRISLFLKNELDLTKWFKFAYGANANFSRNKSSQAEIGDLGAMPYERLTDDEGMPVYIYDSFKDGMPNGYNYYRAQQINETEGLKFMGFNALEEADKNMLKEKTMYLKLFAHADFKILKGLDLGVKFQYEKTNYDNEQYDEEDSYKMRKMINQFASNDGRGGFVYNIPEGGHMAEKHDRYDNLNFRAQLNYHTTIDEKHDIVALAGGEIRQDGYRSTRGERYGYDSRKLTYTQVDWLTLNQTGVVGQLYGNPQKSGEVLGMQDVMHRYVSAYANFGYTYSSRYTFNGSVRVEQADLFGTDPKYRYRPLWSVGASWNASNEDFLKEVNWLNVLKVRLTYGITGSVDQSSSPYLIGTYNQSNNTNSSITDIRTPPNKMLRWEKTSTVNAGIDFTIFNRLSGTMDFYNRYSSDLLAYKTLDPSLGFGTARVNNGAMQNRGVEFSLSYDWLESKDWSLNTILTASFNSNEIKKVGYIPSNAIDMLGSPYGNYLKGDVYGTVYAYRYAGLTETGDPSVYDENGDVKSNEPVRNIDALVRAGQLTPKWNGGLNISLRWKTLELFTRMVYYTGHSLRNDVTPLYSIYGDIDGGMHKDMVNRWTTDNRNTDVPVMGLHGLDQSRGQHWKYADTHVLSASFIKMRNIGLSYALPRHIVQKMGMDNVSLRAQVNNPFYWAANGEGIDPEAFNANYGSRNQEQVTSYVFGLNINF